LREYGVLPWWSDDRLSIAFFRPLSSALLAIDHRWLDGGGFWSHVHALLWYGLVAAARVLRLLFDGPLLALPWARIWQMHGVRVRITDMSPHPSTNPRGSGP
jgi:hypothetical protein